MMEWNNEEIAFLHPPDTFTGVFDNDKMQRRHEQQLQIKRDDLIAALAREENPLKAMQLLHSKDRLRFLHNNMSHFFCASVFEKALLLLYGKRNAPFSSGGDMAEWYRLFALSDPQKLYEQGCPVTFASATVFRGSISGCKRSLSWTPDKTTAERMAKRWQDQSLGGGRLYEVDISKGDVLVHLRKKNQEDEIIVNPKFITAAKIRDFRL